MKFFLAKTTLGNSKKISAEKNLNLKNAQKKWFLTENRLVETAWKW